MNGIYLLLGSNLNNKADNINTAESLLAQLSVQVIQASSVYKTAPWGKTDQPEFLNKVLRIETHLNPVELLNTIHNIENTMGRSRKGKWESRIIDIDILYFNDLVIETDQLTIPHPQIINRRFTLVPLVEIAPDEIHPVLKLSNRDMLHQTGDPGRVDFL